MKKEPVTPLKEELISFETAKLAKEKGFGEKVYREYDKSGYLRCTSKSADVVLGPYDELLKSTEYPAPTQSLLQRWLREVHKINIFISSKTIENKTIFIPHGRTIPDTIKNNLIVDIIQYCTNNTYEEALEIGLQKALKLI